MKEWLEGLGLSKETIDSVMAYISNLAVNYAGKVAGAIVILLLAMFISGWVRSMVEKALTRVNFDPTLTKFFGTASRWVVLLLAVLGCLGMFGIETTSFAAVIGGASLAVGLAFQGSLSNVAAGVMLLTFRPFSVGQVITVAGQTGKVDEIGLFTTALNTPDNRHIIIPNGQVFGSTIVNITHNPKRRVGVSIGIGYDDDLGDGGECRSSERTLRAFSEESVSKPCSVTHGRGEAFVSITFQSSGAPHIVTSKRSTKACARSSRRRWVQGRAHCQARS